MKTATTKEMTIKTFGELCEALAEQGLPATVEDGYYVVRKGDLRRFIQPPARERLPLLLDMLVYESVRAAG